MAASYQLRFRAWYLLNVLLHYKINWLYQRLRNLLLRVVAIAL